MDIPDAIFKRAKLKAIIEGVCLKTVIVRALEREVGASNDNAPIRERAKRLFAALDRAPNKKTVGRLKREGLYDRPLLRRH